MKKILLITVGIIFFIVIWKGPSNDEKDNTETIVKKESKQEVKKKEYVNNRIIKPTEYQMRTIIDGLKPMVVVGGKSCAIKSKDYENSYFVALELYKYYQSINKQEYIGIGVWSLGGSGGSCYSTNNIATENSFWGNINVSMYDEGALDVKKHISNGKGFDIPKD